MKPEISAFIVCCNEERNIRRCLESVKWCGEIIIIDSGSTDRTLEICGEFGAKIYHRDWTGYVDQKSFGLSKCSFPWIINIDADEEVSPQLRDEILALAKTPGFQRGEIKGYSISRVVYHLGKWWRRGGWYPEYRLRLCFRQSSRWGGVDPHEKALVDGPTARLKGELRHYTYSGIADQITRLNRYSSTSALSMYKNGERASMLQILLNPFARFFKFYLTKKGFLEGFAGLIVAVIEAYATFLKYVKLWELERNDRLNLSHSRQSD